MQFLIFPGMQTFFFHFVFNFEVSLFGGQLILMGMLGDHPGKVWWPSCGWWLTVLGMVVDCLGDDVWLPWGWSTTWEFCVRLEDVGLVVSDHLRNGGWWKVLCETFVQTLPWNQMYYISIVYYVFWQAQFQLASLVTSWTEISLNPISPGVLDPGNTPDSIRALNCCFTLKLCVCFQKYKLTSHWSKSQKVSEILRFERKKNH